MHHWIDPQHSNNQREIGRHGGVSPLVTVLDETFSYNLIALVRLYLIMRVAACFKS
jgi:hypothetical protein